MVPRPSKVHTAASLGAGTLCLASCTLLVDGGVTYHACKREAYVQPFSGATTLETLLEQCWQVSGVPAESDDVFVDDGDLVIRVHAPTSGAAAQWSGDEQGPFVFQAFEGDFIVVARLEVLSQISGDLCLEPGNGVGLALRDTTKTPAWATILLEPFMPDPPIPDARCDDEATVPVPVRMRVESKDGAWSEPRTEEGQDGRLGVGTDGEADVALCKIHDAVFVFYRDPATPANAPEWVEVGADGGLATGEIALEVGFTAKGTSPAFEAEGHFTWVTLVDSIGSDGCRGALEEIALPGGRMIARYAAVVTAIVLSSVTRASPGYAQPAEPPPAEAPPPAADLAIEKGGRGVELYERGQWAAALELFRQADQLYHSPVFSLYIARSERNLGHLRAAKEVYVALAKETVPAGAPVSWTKAQTDGTAELRALEEEIPRVRVKAIGATASARASIDGDEMPIGPYFERDPGTHDIVVVDGGAVASTKITLSKGEHEREVTVDLHPRVPPKPQGPNGPWVLGIAMTALGGAGVVAGAVTGALALDRAAAADAALPASCNAERSCPDYEQAGIESSYEEATTLAAATDGLLVAGGVVAVVGIVLIVVDPGGGARKGRAGATPTGFSLRF